LCKINASKENNKIKVEDFSFYLSNAISFHYRHMSLHTKRLLRQMLQLNFLKKMGQTGQNRQFIKQNRKVTNIIHLYNVY